MQPPKKDFLRPMKPQLQSKTKINDSPEEIIQKISIYYRYRLATLYRKLKLPIYEQLLESKKPKINKQKNNLSFDEAVDSAYKFLILNSKYHHREKMRFSRTPLFKYIKYSFEDLRKKMDSKKFMENYEDLQDDYDNDQEPNQKKIYEKDPKFSHQALQTYKKKHQIRGYIVVAQGYDDLKNQLITKYGWTENHDTQSLYYDFKFMSKKKDIDTVNLLDSQIINHFQQNKSITAKFGLCRNIRNLIALGGNPHIFFPKCFDVNDVVELQDFYQEFKFGSIVRLLKDCMNRKGQVFSHQENIVELALKIIRRLLLPINQKISNILKFRPIYVQQDEFLKIEQYWNIKNKNKETIQIKQQAIKQINYVLETLKQTDWQYELNHENVWIVKPASMSRGRGIKTFNNLQQIFDYIAGKQISWVIQKYIERPLIIKKRKFDIRQWVLLTDWKPIKIWVYDECYIRFCAQLYNVDDLKNRKIHLTNNSVTKGVSSIQDDGIKQNMMSQQQFSLHLESLQNKQIFNSLIKPQIKKIAVDTLKSVSENIINRKNTLQVFGYDFMIDQSYKVWLIEVNSSPTMQYSTQITQKLVKKGMADLGDLIVHYMMNGKYYKGPQFYGGWKLVT